MYQAYLRLPRTALRFRDMKKSIFALIAVIAIAVTVLFYAFRPLKAPGSGVPMAPAPAPTETAYTVIPEESSVTFTLGETLRGKPFTVVGSTKAVSGVLVAGEAGPSGEIRVDALTLKTDAESRDRAIGRFILESEKAENRFIVFKVDRMTGTAGATEVGGWLTVHGITKPVVFAGTQEMVGEGMLVIKASATVKRGDFNLVIPSVPFVADVDDTVRLDADIAFGVM